MPSVLINITGAENNTVLVPAPGPNSFIRVSGFNITASATSTVTFESGDSTPKSINYLSTGNSMSAYAPLTGVFDCAKGEALTITTTAGNVGGSLLYTIMGNVKPVQ